jgi:hypothetical protein
MYKPLIYTFTIFLTSCASQPDDLPASYVSPVQYQGFSCAQIGSELERVTRRANDLHGGLKKKADNDAVQMGVGLVLLWPTLFALEGGDGADASEYSRLKGERDALEQAAIQKNCSATTVPEVVDSAPSES